MRWDAFSGESTQSVRNRLSVWELGIGRSDTVRCHVTGVLVCPGLVLMSLVTASLWQNPHALQGYLAVSHERGTPVHTSLCSVWH